MPTVATFRPPSSLTRTHSCVSAYRKSLGLILTLRASIKRQLHHAGRFNAAPNIDANFGPDGGVFRRHVGHCNRLLQCRRKRAASDFANPALCTATQVAAD